MTLLADTGTCRLVLGFDGPLAQDLQVVHHAIFDTDGSLVAQDLLDLARDAYNAYISPWRDIMADNFTIRDVKVYERDFTANVWLPVGVEPIGGVGNIVTSALPPQIAYGVTLYTENPRVIGYSYWPGAPINGMAASGVMGAARQAEVVAAFGNLIAPFVSGAKTLSWGVWSVRLGAVADIASVACDVNYDTQRRRKAGIGS